MGLILGIAVITFAFVGLNANMLSSVTPGNVVVAGGRTVSPAEFSRMFNLGLDQMQQERGQRPSIEEAVRLGLERQLLEGLSTEYAGLALTERLGLRPGLSLIGDQIKQQQAFFDPVTGRFDPQTYRQLLADNQLNERTYEQALSDEIARRHLFAALGAGFNAPTSMAALEAIRATQMREVQYFLLTPASIAPVGDPTDEQLQAFIVDRGVTKPERRALTIARFSTAAIMSSVEVDQAQVDRLLAFRAEELSTPETRTLVQLTARDQAQARTIAQRLTAGENPETVANALRANFVRHEAKPKTALPDRKVADAAFALREGAVSEPIEGELGWAVVKVQAVRPGSTPNLAELRDEAEQEARRLAASARVSDIAEQLLDAVEAGEELTTVAQRLSARIQTTPPIDRNSRTDTAQLVEGVSPAILQAAFGAQPGEVSDIAQEAAGEYFVVRVDRIVPSAPPTVAEARALLTDEWRLGEVQRRLQARATELAARVRQGESLQAVAAASGASVQSITGLNEANAQTFVQAHPPQVLGAALQGLKDQVLSDSAAQAGGPQGQQTPRFFVAKLVDVQAGEVDAAAQIAQRAEQSAVQMLQQQLAELLSIAARDVIRPRTYPDRALRALGVSASAASAASGTKDKAKDK